MRKTEVQLQHIKLLICVCLLGVNTVIGYGGPFNEGVKADTTSNVKADTLSLVLAMEQCPKQQFSFCSDGYEQPYRGQPLLVQLDTNNFMDSYKGKVFSLSTFNPSGFVSYYISTPWYKDSVLKSYVSNDNVISFYNKKFQRKVQRYLKKNKLDKGFDGKFYYALFKMKFIASYQGRHKILLPTIGKKSRNAIISQFECDIYCIDSIISVYPLIR